MYGEMMKIQLGKIYINRTRKYLFPIIKEYDTEFTSKINSMFKVGIGIGDMILNKSGIHHEKHIFLLVDAKASVVNFHETLEWLREHPAYEDDYAYDNVYDGRLHMIVIKIPNNRIETFEKFKCGQFSKMYTPEDIKKFFTYHGKDQEGMKMYQNIQKVLIHEHNYKIEFAKQIQQEFHIPEHYSPNEIDPNAEFDFPILLQEEFFNVKPKGEE